MKAARFANRFGALAVLFLASPPAGAGPADVVGAQVRCSKNGKCIVWATVKHADEGWDHYANRWDVLGPDGEVIAKRVLRHPHVKQQPFTRALEGVAIPEDVSEVTIRANDSVHGLGGAEKTVKVAR